MRHEQEFIERRIITGLIVSDGFCRKMLPSLRREWFTIEYAGEIFSWIQEYYKTYKTAPGKDIEHIFNERREQVTEAQEKLIEEFLTKLSARHEREAEFNIEYRVGQAKEYITDRALKVTADSIQQAIEVGRSDKAEQAILSYQTVAKETSEWVNPLDDSFIKDTILAEEEGTDRIFRFPGALGRLAGGYHERGEIVCFLAPMKRGKTFMLTESSVQCLLNRKKVAFFSLEMATRPMGKRILRRLTSFAKEAGDYVIPVFDCSKNQDGSCDLEERTSKVSLLDEDGEKPQFRKGMKYKVCTACRGKKGYEVATWFTIRKKDKMEIKNTLRRVRAIRKMFGDNFRLRAFSAGEVNVAGLKSALDELEYEEGFVPDVVVVDQPRNLRPEDSRVVEKRHRSDDTWRALKSLIDSLNALLLAAHQGTRKSIKKASMDQEDVSEDIMIVGHVNWLYALNQTREEKRAGVMRLGIIAAREEDYDERQHCIILQQRGLGQTLLDSELVWGKFDKEYDKEDAIFASAIKEDDE